VPEHQHSDELETRIPDTIVNALTTLELSSDTISELPDTVCVCVCVCACTYFFMAENVLKTFLFFQLSTISAILGVGVVVGVFKPSFEST
jgi:hypothetical protein